MSSLAAAPDNGRDGMNVVVATVLLVATEGVIDCDREVEDKECIAGLLEYDKRRLQAIKAKAGEQEDLCDCVMAESEFAADEGWRTWREEPDSWPRPAYRKARSILHDLGKEDPRQYI
ncbi:uncharacterized protein BP01DRAFT_379059 [Aspergillus saccharolyticus JOP 1030-1]|uniref:Uncharacterized protein n=1 Tax=Aspergillus saccharolyticus JOP 1030-1 TaxID=1450539 RepID=A0A318ZZ50_9EURO|nr:hypothetical protein BP01DRAFT_379059 [Aspergillus saccharolyticus JOP 1030-1]PYH49490.1 hypothetical protein BP01DRAFT_379059 [Aspergillus saccharolyticus JOP 1030-1]